MTHITFIGSASGWGAQIRGTEKGPVFFRNSGILSSMTHWTWKETIFPPKQSQDIDLPLGPLILPYIEDVCRRMAHSTSNSLQNHQFPVVIGGDHAIAAGTWSGVAHALAAAQKFGLIWIDAHMDAHTMQTTPSQAYHGMPLAALLGYGDAALVNILEKGPVLNPQHVCLIGIRSYEEGEIALLERLGVRIYFMKEVRKRGFQTVFQESLDHVKRGTKGFGLSIDLDAFDPQEAPGVGTPEPLGLQAQEVLPAFETIQNDPHFKALEIVEYNPDRDEDEKTLRLMRDLLLKLLPKEGRPS